jgi:hypothetical protein
VPVSITLVPSVNNIFVDLSVAPKVTPDPELVLNVTLCAPVVALFTI